MFPWGQQVEETKEARKSEDRLRFLEFHPRLDAANSKKHWKRWWLLFSIWPVLAFILDFRELWMISYPYLVWESTRKELKTMSFFQWKWLFFLVCEEAMRFKILMNQIFFCWQIHWGIVATFHGSSRWHAKAILKGTNPIQCISMWYMYKTSFNNVIYHYM